MGFLRSTKAPAVRAHWYSFEYSSTQLSLNLLISLTSRNHLIGWQFDSLLEAQVLIENHRIDYNMNRPHSVTGGSPPSSSPTTGPPPTKPNPHKPWTIYWGPLMEPRPTIETQVARR